MGRVYTRQPVGERIAALTGPELNTGCWLWAGQVDQHGYPVLKVPREDGKGWAPKRVGRLVLAPIAANECACHRCDTPLCVNPDHLYRGTRAQNSKDMADRGRSMRGERSASARLTADDVRWLREQHAQGRRQVDLANELGVDPSTVSYAVRGERWRHIQ